MTFPNPKNVSDWQTAYTRDDAFKEYGKHNQLSDLVMLLGGLSISIFIAILASPRINLTSLSIYLKLVLFLVLVVLVFIVLILVKSRATCFAKIFFGDFYQPPEEIDPTKIIDYRLHGRLKLPPPFNLLSQFKYIMAKEGEIAVRSEKWPAWSARNLGGPILLIVFDGCALYLEHGNRFSRIVGPGDKAPFLEWYETIKYVVDLRPKIKSGNFDVWTKDGINLNLIIQIECRIGDPKLNPPATSLVYPYDPVAIKKAIERYSVRWPNRADPDPSEFTWIDAAWGQVTGIVPGYISSRILNDLIVEDRKSGQILSPEAVKELFGKLNIETQKFGVYVTDFQVLEIKMPQEVDEHMKEYWKAERQSISTLLDGEAKASHIRSREKGRAEAQYDLIVSIAEGLRKNKSGQFTEPVLMSLSGVLDESLREPLTRAYLAKETLDTLEQLQKIVHDNEPSEFSKLFGEDRK